MDDINIELIKLASELETVKLLGVLLFFSMIVMAILVIAVVRNMRSQDHQNEQAVDASFGIITKLVDKLEATVQNSNETAKEMFKVTTLLDNLNKQITSLHDKHDAVLLLLVPPTTSAQVAEESVKITEG